MLLQLHRHTQHLLRIGHLERAERRIHIHVALQEEDPVGELLDMTHLGDRDLAHDARKIPIARIFEMRMEIHVLERGGDLLAHGIVQQVDARLILGLYFGGIHK